MSKHPTRCSKVHLSRQTKTPTFHVRQPGAQGPTTCQKCEDGPTCKHQLRLVGTWVSLPDPMHATQAQTDVGRNGGSNSEITLQSFDLFPAPTNESRSSQLHRQPPHARLSPVNITRSALTSHISPEKGRAAFAITR